MEDRTLSETLSARQFFADPLFQATDHANSSRYIRPNTRAQDKKGKRKASVSPDRTKKRGRPRIASANDRRTQVRVAQRAYRLKKETMFRDMEERLAELEASMTNMSDSLSSFYQMAIQSDLHITHPGLFGRLVQTVRDVTAMTSSTTAACPEDSLGGNRGPQAISLNPSSDRPTFGYVVDSTPNVNYAAYSRASTSATRSSSPACIYDLPSRVHRPLPGHTNFSFSFNESSFSRRLHRFCLEHIYRLIMDPRSDPKEVYRVFRLMPCIKYKDRMIPYLKCLVWAGPNEDLETPAVPFYCIGGAGTHYPHTEDGSPVYPENMRLPRKILGTLPKEISEEQETPEGQRHELLKIHGLDGVWLDCRDVEGFLHAKGIAFNETGPTGPSSPKSLSAMNIATPPVEVIPENQGSTVRQPHMDTKTGRTTHQTLSLNVEELLPLLLKNMIILGRAPGFRLSDVESAFQLSVKISCD
ncbi:hypothetical protein FE257_010378 [Aspergillus nanangensis]|uniref:BZIP domain-containing protein n=1 Tax=Aspergillus nanangensis TaxID=2582783 RepID=A0AAD4CIQ0_ASPNN|nr:hypothetical protein FE257_010378 [Aspergillus nanangensis]